MGSPIFIAKLKKKVEDNPSRSATKLAEEMGVGLTTIKICINEDIRYRFYKRCQGQILTQKAQKWLAENLFNCISPNIWPANS